MKTRGLFYGFLFGPLTRDKVFSGLAIFVTTLGFWLVSQETASAQVTEAWVASYDVVDQIATDIAVDSAGKVYVTGGSLEYRTYITIKYDALGNEQWARSTLDGAAHAIAVDNAGNVYVTGSGGTIKYDTNGNELWVKSTDDPDSYIDSAQAMAVDSSGNVYVAGTYNNDYVTIKYLPDGQRSWYSFYDGPGHGSDNVKAMAIDGFGNVYVTGVSYGSGTSNDYATTKYDADGNELWVCRYNGPGDENDTAVSIAVDALGNVYVTGASRGTDTDYDYVTIKYGSNGAELWVARDLTGAYESPRALALDSNGNVYVTGVIGQGAYSDYRTIKYDNNGNKLWHVTYNGPGNERDWAYDLAVDGDGNVYVTGASILATGSGTDYATIKYNTNGGKIWEARYNCQGWDYARAIVLDSDNNVYVTGNGECFETGENYVTIKYQQENTTVLSVSLEGSGSGTVTSDPPGIDCGTDCEEVYEIGTEVALTASPDVGSYFLGWSGDCAGTESCTVTVDAEKAITATFDVVPTVYVFIDDAMVRERLDGSSEAVFWITLTRSITPTITVDYATADGTAIAGIDYIAASGTLTFPAGTTAQTVMVEIPSSLPPIGDKTFFVNLSNPTNAIIGDGEGKATISAISPETRSPKDHGYFHYDEVCTEFGDCWMDFQFFRGGNIHVYEYEYINWPPLIEIEYKVGVAEFDVSSIAPGIESADLNLTFDHFDQGGFWVSYLLDEGDGIVDNNDYFNCRSQFQRVHVGWVGSADQKRVDIKDTLQWASDNNLRYLTCCFHEPTERRSYEFREPTIHFVPSDDLDLDNVPNNIDNCLLTPNTDQADFDQDGQGDACDGDDDNDGLTDEFEIGNSLNPFDEDMDDDGLTDYEEVCYDGDCESYDPYQYQGDTDANNPDTDGGGKGDYLEVFYGTDALDQWDDIVICQASVQLTDTSSYSADPEYSISADGTKIAYRGCDNAVGSTCYGNRLIYFLEFKDGAWQPPVQVSDTATTWNVLPSINADGTRIAYRGSDGDSEIYFVEYKDGIWQVPVKITDNTTTDDSPSISADGTKIFYNGCDGGGTGTQCSDGDYEIYMVEYDGMSWQDAVKVTDNTVADYDPATTPDGTKIAYVGCNGGTDYLCSGGTWEIYFTEYSGGTWQEPISVGTDAAYITYPTTRISLNADGTKIVYQGAGVSLVEYKDGSWQLPFGVGGGRYPSINADGTKIGCQYDGMFAYYEFRNGTWLGPARTYGIYDGSYQVYPVMSSDGTKIIYRGYVGYDYEIYFMGCVPGAVDTDADGIFDDGDWSGVIGDNYCWGQTPAYCDDNCPTVTNPNQTDTNMDGVGDACEKCPGDLDGDGDVDGSDLAVFAADGTDVSLEEFAANFGRIDCPILE